jgi:hypothetical protein
MPTARPGWTRIRRPLVIVGGELTIGTMDLVCSRVIGLYEAPFQMKVNGDILVIDDFGRQRVNPRDLLNRWISLLEGGGLPDAHTKRNIEVPLS